MTCIDNDDIRKSAAWSGGDGDDEDLFEDDRFLDFGDSMYSDSAAAAGKKATVVNSVSYTRNRAKITNPKVNIHNGSSVCISNVFENYRDENRAYSPTTTTTTTTAAPPPPPPPTTTATPPPTAAAASLNAHMRGKMAAGARSGGAAARAQRRGARNKLAVRSGR